MQVGAKLYGRLVVARARDQALTLSLILSINTSGIWMNRQIDETWTEFWDVREFSNFDKFSTRGLLPVKK